MRPARETASSGPRIVRTEARRAWDAAPREQQLASRLGAIAWTTRRLGHALNNELTVVLGNARWLGDGGERDEEAAADLRESGERCAALADALLRWIARVQCDAPPERLRALLDETRPLLAVFTSGGAAELAVEIPPGCDPVVADPERTSRMLVYLAACAREVLGAGPRLRARVVPAGHETPLALELCVEGEEAGSSRREHVARCLDGAVRTAPAGEEDESALARAVALAREAGSALRADAGAGGRVVLGVRLPLDRAPG